MHITWAALPSSFCLLTYIYLLCIHLRFYLYCLAREYPRCKIYPFSGYSFLSILRHCIMMNEAKGYEDDLSLVRCERFGQDHWKKRKIEDGVFRLEPVLLESLLGIGCFGLWVMRFHVDAKGNAFCFYELKIHDSCMGMLFMNWRCVDSLCWCCCIDGTC